MGVVVAGVTCTRKTKKRQIKKKKIKKQFMSVLKKAEQMEESMYDVANQKDLGQRLCSCQS